MAFLLSRSSNFMHALKTKINFPLSKKYRSNYFFITNNSIKTLAGDQDCRKVHSTILDKSPATSSVFRRFESTSAGEQLEFPYTGNEEVGAENLIGVGDITTETTWSVQESLEPTISRNEIEYADVDWNNLGFGLMQTEYMYTMKCNKGEDFKQGQLGRYGNIELSPSAGILNYGQGLFEGTKAYRREDGSLFLFRPAENAIRMQIGAERLCMPSPSIEQFVNAVKETTVANRRWIPPPGKGSLYIRALLMGSGAILGLAPSSEYTFLIFASPVGNYFKEGTTPLNLYIEEEYHRATRGGAGGVKSITNYAPVLKAVSRAKDRGFSDVLYLDSVKKRNIEEVSSCNIFIVKGNVISTPATDGTILAGITRKSIMEIAYDLGYKVEERSIPVEEVIDADEVFCTGTAVGVAPVGSITYQGKRVEYKSNTQPVCSKLYSILTGIQKGTVEDKHGWIVKLE